MATSYFQGGEFVELLSAQGKAPAAHWKLQGKVSKSFEKLIKGNAFVLGGGTDTRMQLPKGGGGGGINGTGNTAASSSLGLTQRFLVLQLLVPLAKSFSLEIGFADLQRARRRLVISSAFRELSVTALHAQIPLGAAAVPRDSWMNLVLDLQALTDAFFHGSAFRSMESLAIGGSCRLKRVFTMKDAPVPRGCERDDRCGTADIPRQLVFSCGRDNSVVPTEYFAVPSECGANASDSRLAFDGARDKRAVAAGLGPVTGKRVPGFSRKATGADSKTKNNRAESAGSGPSTARRTATPVSRGGRSRVPTRGSGARRENANDDERSESAAPIAIKPAPREGKKPQEVRVVTPSLDSVEQLSERLRGSAEVDAKSDAKNDELPSGDCDVRTRQESRPASAALKWSDMSVRRDAEVDRQAPDCSGWIGDRQSVGVEDRGDEERAALSSRPPGSRGGGAEGEGDGAKEDSRRELVREIRHKLDLLADEDERQGERNCELFLRHTALLQDRGVELDDLDLAPSTQEHAPADGLWLCKPAGIDNGADTIISDAIRPSSKTNASIFKFTFGSIDREHATDSARSSARSPEARDTSAVAPSRRRRIFDFDTLLDPNSAPASPLDPSDLGSVAPVESPTEMAVALTPLSDTVDENPDEDGDAGSDHELELLLAAKRAARREQQQQQQAQTAAPQQAMSSEDREKESASRSDPERPCVDDEQRKSRSVWSFSNQVPITSATATVEAADHDCEGGGAGEDRCYDDERSQDDDLSIDLTDELEDIGEGASVAVGGASAVHETPSSALSPVRHKTQEKAPHRSPSRAPEPSVASASFDFGDLVESGDEEEDGELTKLPPSRVQGRQSTQLLNSSSAIFASPLGESFDLSDLTGGGAPTESRWSAQVAGESSTSKRLQRLLSSTEWRSQPGLGTGDPTRARLDQSDGRESAARSPPPTRPAAQPSTSLELVYDPVLRCYYDPVGDKYYALAK